MHQITPFKKYVIPIYKKLGFPKFWSFPASFSVFQKYKGISKFIKEKYDIYNFKFFHFIKKC
jgi:hypothetical protein